ncbi:MAG: cupin domain-containing protein, partial [Chloroflexota bacterium]|nr:cupin domain-containing protein [Chloroflexota bacterium]
MATAPAQVQQQSYVRKPQFYDRWMEAQGIPIYRDYYIEDGRTIELGYWKERGHNAAFLQLAGQEGVSEARITEVPAGGSVPPFKMTLEDVVYVLSGRGVTTIWKDGGEKHSFEWTDHAMFRIPGNYWVEYASMSGGQPARLLHYNNMPIAMSAAKDANIFFNTPLQPMEELVSSDEFYSDAVVVDNDPSGRGAVRQYWVGNFFPDMRAWDRLVPFKGRGAGGTTVFVQYPGSELTAHMSVFPAKTYKKGHRHGPAYVIVIPAGEGFSVMWPEGQEKVFIPWHEGSIFVPPNRWFHQHFNVGETPGRYLAFHPLPQFTGLGNERVNR